MANVVFSPLDRRIVLMRAGKTHREVALAIGVSRNLVTEVVRGTRLTGTNARRVMRYIANLAGRPVHEVFADARVDGQEGNAE